MHIETMPVEQINILPSLAYTTTQDSANEETIQAFLVEQIAQTTGLPLHKIDISQPFSYYGIDSVAAAGLSGELSRWLGIRLAPTITWDYPSVRLLARYLSQPKSAKCP